MFEPDEFLFTKFAHFFKRRQKRKQEQLKHVAKLEDLKSRLTIFARAITGDAISIFEAEREGGYKNNSFFLPKVIDAFPEIENNISVFLFRTLYLSVQHNLNLNWDDEAEHSVEESREAARNNSENILKILFDEFPASKLYYDKLVAHYLAVTAKGSDFDGSFIYGKWMQHSTDEELGDSLQNFGDKVKNANAEEDKTLRKAGAVEEIKSVQIDQQQLDDAVLQHQFEKVETAEEFGGNWRDMDGDDELDDHANALDDINMKYTVRVDDATHSVYQADFIENTTISESAQQEGEGHFLTYDEWDYRKSAYKPDFCHVYPKSGAKLNVGFYKKTMSENRSTLLGLRKMLANVNNQYQTQKRQTQGEEFDIDALTDLLVDIHSGHTPSEKIYLSTRKKEKDISILLLLDVSLSSDGYAAGNKVIDVEKQVSILFGEILHAYDIDFEIDGFYSKTRNHASYQTVKAFDDDWNTAKHKVGGLEPMGYTRIGAALRHAGARLDARSTKNKWVILLSDGKPNDYDQYEGKYGIQDVKLALRELGSRDIHSYALAIEAQAKYYLPQMFGQNNYQILTTPTDLLKSLVVLYDKIRNQN